MCFIKTGHFNRNYAFQQAVWNYIKHRKQLQCLLYYVFSTWLNLNDCWTTCIGMDAFIYLFIYLFICSLIYMYVCMNVCTYACMYVRMYVCMYVCRYVCIYVCMYEFMYICTYIFMYLGIYVHRYVCMYVDRYVYMYISRPMAWIQIHEAKRNLHFLLLRV